MLPVLGQIADRQPQLPLRRELPDRVVQVVGEPDAAVGPDVDAVGAADQSLAPRAQELAVPVEDDHRVLTPVEDPDVVTGVDGDARRFHEGPALGQAAPAFDRAVLHDGLLSPRCRRRRLYCHIRRTSTTSPGPGPASSTLLA